MKVVSLLVICTLLGLCNDASGSPVFNDFQKPKEKSSRLNAITTRDQPVLNNKTSVRVLRGVVRSLETILKKSESAISTTSKAVENLLQGMAISHVINVNCPNTGDLNVHNYETSIDLLRKAIHDGEIILKKSKSAISTTNQVIDSLLQDMLTNHVRNVNCPNTGDLKVHNYETSINLLKKAISDEESILKLSKSVISTIRQVIDMLLQGMATNRAENVNCPKTRDLNVHYFETSINLLISALSDEEIILESSESAISATSQVIDILSQGNNGNVNCPNTGDLNSSHIKDEKTENGFESTLKTESEISTKNNTERNLGTISEAAI